jgi:hypothetical protein
MVLVRMVPPRLGLGDHRRRGSPEGTDMGEQCIWRRLQSVISIEQKMSIIPRHLPSDGS